MGINNRVWAIQKNGAWARWAPEYSRWDTYSESRQFIFADPSTGQACYYVDPDGTVHWRNVDQNVNKSFPGINATMISVGGDNRLWAIQKNGAWARWAPEYSRWDTYSENRQFILADPATGQACYYVDPDGSVHWRNVDRNENKKFSGIKTVQVSVGGQFSNQNSVKNPPLNSFEDIQTEEAEQIKQITGLTVTLLNKRYPAPLKCLRGVHPKSHGCVKATFEVNADIAENLQVGLFTSPGKTYQAWVRLSNAVGQLGPDVKDGKNQSRGLAIKVMDIGGNVLLDDNGAHHQDFLLITEPAFAFANVADYLRLNEILVEHNEDVRPFFAPPQNATVEEKQRIQQTLQLVGQIIQTPVANPFDVQYFGAAPFLFGTDRVMKFSVLPCEGAQIQTAPANPSDNYLREATLKTISESKDICFDFMIQVRSKNDKNLNIENASTTWDEQQTPFIKVAKITIPAPQNDMNSPAAIEHCETLSYSPWHSLIEHQPLGSINRLRKAVYIASQTRRK